MRAMPASQAVNKLLGDFMQAANDLQNDIPQRANLHCFISIPGTPNETESSIFPLVSSLFHSALHSSRRGSTIVGQALRDTFLIAHRVSDGRFYYGPRADNLPRPGQRPSDTVTPSVPALGLPAWFPSAPTERHDTNDADTDIPEFITCRHFHTTEIERLVITKISQVYVDLFGALWEKGHKEVRVTGRSIYPKMTPP